MTKRMKQLPFEPLVRNNNDKNNNNNNNKYKYIYIYINIKMILIIIIFYNNKIVNTSSSSRTGI